MFKSPLHRALVCGLAPGGDLRGQLKSLGRYAVRTEQDARAIIDTLQMFPLPETDGAGALEAVVDLFAAVGPKHSPAAKLLRKLGTQELIRIFDELVRNPTAENVDTTILIILRTLARYGTRESAERIVEAARMGIGRAECLWNFILTTFSAHHQQRDFVFESLSSPLPRDVIAWALLDAANDFAMERDLQHHPFDSEQGQNKLRQWLTSCYVERVKYARSAAMALPFIHGKERDNLLGLARDHADIRVRINAAWASAHVGQEVGFRMLRTYSRDPICFKEGFEYLISLDRQDDLWGVGEEVDKDFFVKAKFAASFAKDNFYRQSLPDELTIVDRRKLYWPPAGRKLTLWLIRYVLHDPYGLKPDGVGCGVVGASVDHYPLFDCHLLPPEDCYAIHCFAEAKLEHHFVNPAEYAPMLQQWPHEPLEDAVVVRVVDIPAHWKYGRRLVALAEAKINGQQGWAVIDGPQSAWYPSCEMPEDQHELAPLMIHVGSRLLGFGGRPDRKKYLAGCASKEPSPSQVVEVYEELLSEFTDGEDFDLKCMLIDDRASALTEHMQTYAAAREQLGLETKENAFIRVFDTILETATELPPDPAGQAYYSIGPLGPNFEAYVDAMRSLGRQDALAATIQGLEPYWFSCGIVRTARRHITPGNFT